MRKHQEWIRTSVMLALALAACDADRPELLEEMPSQAGPSYEVSGLPPHTDTTADTPSAKPVIKDVSPRSGLMNRRTQVVLNGENFTGSTKVSIRDGVGMPWRSIDKLDVSFVSDKQLKVTLPETTRPGSIDFKVEVTVGGGGKKSGAANALFSYAPTNLSFNRTSLTSGYALTSLTSGDLDKDGFDDLAVIHETDPEVTILYSDGLGDTKEEYIFDLPCLGSRAIAAHDINRDGALDLIVACHDPDEVQVYLNNPFGLCGGAPFCPPTSLTVGTTPAAIAATDLNADGLVDLLVANAGDGSLSVLLGSGGGFAAAVEYPVGRSPIALVVSDLDGDLKPDVAVANGASDSVSLLFNKGSGEFDLPAKSVATQRGPVSLAAADLNQDGKPELVLAALGAGAVSVLTQDGRRSYSESRVHPVGFLPRALVAGDLNGDGRPDVAVTRRDAGTVNILLGVGDGSFQDDTELVTGVKPDALVFANLDGKRQRDLVVANSGSARLTILLNQTP